VNTFVTTIAPVAPVASGATGKTVKTIHQGVIRCGKPVLKNLKVNVRADFNRNVRLSQ
jgi:hypothetical protein